MPSSLTDSQRRAVLAMMSLYDLRKRYAVTFPVRRGEVRDSLEDVALKREWMDMQMQAQTVSPVNSGRNMHTDERIAQ